MSKHVQFSRHGFTLIELVMVMGILLVLGAIAAPRYASANSRYRVEFASRRVAADLVLAQNTARTQGLETKVTFNLAENSYAMTGVDALDGSGNYQVTLSAPPYFAILDTATFNGSSTLTFNGWGVADANGVVTMHVGTEQRTVRLNRLSGEVTIQ